MTHTIGFAGELLIYSAVGAFVVAGWCLSYNVADYAASKFLAFRYNQEAFISSVTVIVHAEAVLLYGVVVLGRGGHGGHLPLAELVAVVFAYAALIAVFAAGRIIGWRLVHGGRGEVPA